MSRPQVLIAQPIYGWVPAEAAMAFAQLVGRTSRLGLCSGIGQTSYGILSQARNILLTQVFAHPSQPTHVLFVDSDMVVPEDVLERLLAHRKSVVSALYFMRRPPYLPVAIKGDSKVGEPTKFFVDYPPGLSTVASVGMGCCLIETSVLRQIQDKYKDEKWFSFENNEGEDIWFCKRARSLGHSIYLDADAKCGHVGEFIVRESHFKLGYEGDKASVAKALTGKYEPEPVNV